MKKLLLLLVVCLFPFSVFSLEYPTVNSKKVEIYDLNDKKVLHEIDSSDKTSIASLTKIATTMVAIENIKNLDEEVTITPKIIASVDSEASVAGLKLNDKVTYKDLLYASMLPSGADATNAIAISSTGSIDNYVDKMNELAKKLKLNNTHFNNVTGLDDPNHYSSADDMIKLLEYALSNKLFKEIYTTKEYELSNGLKVKSTLYKYNASQDTMNKIIGSKTGFTGNAGYCLSSLSNINGHEMIIIVLNADKTYNLNDTVSFINYLNENFKEEILIEKNKLVKTLPVKLSKIDKYDIYSDKEIKKYLPSDYDKKKFVIKYDGLEELNFINKKGSDIGTISYYYDKELLYKQKVEVNKDIKVDIVKVLKKYYYVIIIFVLIVLISIILGKKKNRIKKKK